MLDDEIGMHTLDVKKHGDVLETKLSKENKLLLALREIDTKAKSAYISKNSKSMDSKNTNIESQVEIKVANLNSYKKYVDKMMLAYIATSKKVIKTIEDDRRQMN